MYTKYKILNTKYFLVLLSTLYFLFSSSADAARVYFDPPPTTYKVGDSFTLSLLLNTEEQSINAVEINISVPQLLKIKNISKSGSIIQLWVSEPSFSGRTINLTGGIPGGTTTQKGTIAKITFEATAIGDGNLAFMPNSSVLLNDGLGTKLDITTAGGPVFKVIPRPRETVTVTPKPSDEDTKEKEQPPKDERDKKKPEKFEILFGKDPRVFGGENFVSFFTVDSESGIDHYEIKLGKGDFKVAQAPYLLESLAPRTVIKVRAYDTSGNYREVVYPGLLKRVWWAILSIF